MLSPAVLRHLRNELSRPDPWDLETSAFEQSRFAAMRQLIDANARYQSGLEIGCAAGAFTGFLAATCDRLRVVDVLPEAIRRCRMRLGNSPHVAFSVAQVAESRGWRERYHLIVVSEVLYYLGARPRVSSAIARIKRWLHPGGTLIFGSARDEVSARWGLPCGAETAMREWAIDLMEVRRIACRGLRLDEDCIVVQYRSNG